MCVRAGSECMERGVNALLSRHMARSLRRTVLAHARLACDRAAVRRCRSVREFDAAFTTAHFGFGSVDAYYRAASLHDKLQRSRVPLLCLQAADDPFQPAHGQSAFIDRINPFRITALTTLGLSYYLHWFCLPFVTRRIRQFLG